MPGRKSPWTRILVALAVVDTVVAACVVAVWLTEGLSPSSQPASCWIGVVRDPDQPSGMAVLEVVPGSPADEAGIRPADQILRIDGVSIGSLEELRSAVSEIGEARSVDVSRQPLEQRQAFLGHRQSLSARRAEAWRSARLLTTDDSRSLPSGPESLFSKHAGDGSFA
jgi:membrane-associated protease RseP (regulator of RpoE activity)